MHPILSDRKKLTIYLIIWIIAGFLLSFVASKWFSINLYAAIIFILPMMYVYGEMNLSAWYIAKTFSFNKKSVLTVLGVLLVALIAISSLWTLLCWGWMIVIEQGLGIPVLPQKSLMHFFIVYATGKQLYLISLAISYLMTTFETSRNAEHNAYEAQLLAQSSELKALRMQINPHFLFNSLNSINALITQQPEQARTMTTLLADFFRKSLQFGSKETITLLEEISLLTNYLQIEKIRFGARLNVEQDIDEKALPCSVPPLILQPLLENAIKYGISGTIDGGLVRLRIEKMQERIFITLENPFDSDVPQKNGTGLGLHIVKRRLAAIFGTDADVKTFREKNIFRVVLFFPVK